MVKSSNGKVTERKDWLYRIVRGFSNVVLCARLRIHIEGRENIPRKGAFVLLPKHQRWEDIPLVGIASPRLLYFVAKHELFVKPWENRFFRSLGGLPLNRENPMASRRFIRAVIDLLKKGEGVVLYPEGTYYPDGMGPARLGMVRFIVSRMTIPFIPMGMSYTRKGSRKGSNSIVKIALGAPLLPESGESPASFLNRVMVEIAALSNLAPHPETIDPNKGMLDN